MTSYFRPVAPLSPLSGALMFTSTNHNNKLEPSENVNLIPKLERMETDMEIVDEPGTSSVIIEELDENVNLEDVDMTEFVQAKVLTVRDINNVLECDYINHDVQTTSDNIPDIEDHEVLLPIEEENKLTKQFLNGEIEFCEYAMRMDQEADLELTEVDTNRHETDSNLSSKLKSVNRKAPKYSQPKHKKRRRILPPALQGLMGEANLRFARGEIELASQICMEIIRQVPSAPEPFQTLAMIYENDQPEKSLQFSLIAAHLNPKNADQWVRLANLSLEMGNIKQAITCFSKAIQASPKDINLYELRAQLQEEIGDKKAWLKGLTRLIHHLEPKDGEHIMKVAKIVAKQYMQENNYEQALEAMEVIFLKCSDKITLEEVNVMTELLIVLKQFEKCLNILTQYTNISVKYRLDENTSETTVIIDQLNNNKIESCDIPSMVVVDLKAKFLITLIQLNELEMANQHLPKLYEFEDPEISGDLFLDVAEALMEKNLFEHALFLLEPLVNSNNFSLAAVWLRHAECWAGCENFDRAIASYEVVRKLSPQHLAARIALAKLYRMKGQYSKAIEVLKQDPESDTLDPFVIYKRTLLLFKVKKYSEYFESGILLFSRHCLNIRSKLELNALARATGVRQRLESLQLQRTSCGEKMDEENAPVFLDSNEPSEEKEFYLFIQMCRLAYKLKKFGILQRLCFSALTSKRFEKKNSYILFLCLISCIYNNDSYYGYNIVRELVRVCQRSNSWNLLNIVIQNAEDSRHNRFIMRLLGRVDAFSYLHIMHANNCLVSGTYKYALNDYVSLFREGPNALLALLIAVTLLQMACQKLAAKRNHLVIQATAFLKKYLQLRGEQGKQECYYNIARAFHQIGLLPSAIHYYKLVLELTPDSLIQENSNLLDLKKEAAFNLHLIYLHSENYELARVYLENYIVV